VDQPSAPAAPDPAKTAEAQSASNKSTAIAQYGLNATNQVTPQGSLSYKQIGTWADGTPRFEATTALSQGQQSLYDKGLVTQGNLADIGNQQSAKIGALLNTPVNLNTATEDKIAKLGAARLDPRFAREAESLDTQLINKGIRPGSAAWANAQTAQTQAKNDAYNQLYLTGRGQGAQEALTERNQPINEISALLSGSQVSQPGFTNTPTPGVAPTDVIGAQQQSLNQQNVGYQGQLAQNNAMMSGLFGLGSAGLGGWARSDIGSKENIEVVGERADGLHVIDFDYKPEFGGEKNNRGLIAQEVAQVYPHAVARDRKGLMVNYDAVPRGFMALGKAA
jgi:endosialidase-like protein